MKSFNKHTMYNKAGDGFAANTHEQHLSMKKKGYSHSKPSSTEKKVEKIIKKKSGY